MSLRTSSELQIPSQLQRPVRREEREGATLLFVVTLLVLFTLAGTTFLVIASQYRRSARAAARVETHVEPPKDLADDAMAVLLRGTAERSVIGPHTLLADKYDALQGFKVRLMNQAEETAAMVTCIEAVPGTGYHFVVVRLSSRNNVLGLGLPAANAFGVALGTKWDQTTAQAYTMSSRAGFYNGCEATFLSGPARGITTRIVGFTFTGGAPQMLLMVDRGDTPVPAFPPAIATTGFRESELLINGRPFTGLGAGAFVAGGNAGQMSSEALQINRSNENSTQLITNYIGGGVNESYDAPDLQNVHLGATVTDGSGNVQVIPSFHRPALVNWYLANMATAGVNTNEVMLTPFNRFPSGRTSGDGQYPWLDQIDTAVGAGTIPAPQNTAGPNFPTLRDPTNGPWQVDTDGDLVPDSVWVDLGFPTRTMADGRQYKPYFAVKIEDLDGRLNVNAHGTAWHADTAYQNALLNQVVVDRTANPVNSALVMARGQGFGPAEVSLRTIYQTDAVHTTLLSLRYGADGVPGRLQTVAGTLEPWAEVKFFDIPRLFQNAAALTGPDLRSYSSPPDAQGRFTVVMGVDGMPKYELGNGGTRPNELAESQYEMDLSSDAAHGPLAGNPADRPYTVEELETLLRRFDVDAAALPRRLGDLPGTSMGGLPWESLVTTESWDIPVPGFVAPEPADRINNSGNAPFDSEFRTSTIVDLYVKRRGGAATVAELQAVFAPEVLMGLRMNLNRTFGDGRDNNGNGIVDEHSWDNTTSESVTGEALTTSFATVPLDLDNDGILQSAGDVDEYKSRQIFGTQLYTLIMTLLPRENPGNPAVVSMDMDNDGTGSAEETAFIVAQWVANVIDFRDPDSTNTPFEFDAEPFTGAYLNLDGNPGTDESAAERRLVWGMERPELLITETKAWHDRRTTDESTGMSGMADDDLDTRLKPVGSTFIELYNPWDSSTRAPAEVYGYGGGGPTGVDLRAVGAGGSPTWRMAVYQRPSGDDNYHLRDPDFPNVPSLNGSSLQRQPDPAELDRLVYFIHGNAGVSYPGGPGGSNPRVYYPTEDVFNELGPIGPQRFAIVGSAGSRVPDGGNRYQSLIGQRLDANPSAVNYSDLNPDQTRRIILVAGQSIEIQNNDASSPEIRDVMAIPIGDYVDSAASPAYRNFNVSEPRGGYTGNAWVNRFGADFPNDETTEFALGSPVDQPVDDTQDARLGENGTHANFSIVHLQRLANPLLPYNAVTNPYLTVDSSAIDVTVFNGVTGSETPINGTTTTEFATLERGRRELAGSGRNYAAVGIDQNDLQLWRNELVAASVRTNAANRTASTPVGAADHNFDFALEQSFAAANKAHTARANLSGIVGYPWLAWHNRPFVSQLELMQVPACRSSRLGAEFTVGRPSPATPTYSPANGFEHAHHPNNVTFSINSRHPEFGHLLNWFSSNGVNNGDPQDYPDFHRILEFVNVPSRYLGNDVYLNDTYFNVNSPFTAGRHPPYNWLSGYREPGRVNINTIYHDQVWSGLMGWLNVGQQGYTDAVHQPASFGEFARSRKGFGTNGATWEINSASPEVMANAVRGYGAQELVPQVLNRTRNVEMSLLRSLEDANGASGSNPLMQRTLDANTVQPYENGVRNSHFRYDSMMRMGNLTTTRSNVYAVWITVGYFEVVPMNDGAGNLLMVPDRELGLEDGSIKRERAFYVIDRSIPTGFEPGVDHNVRKTILLRRQIE